MVRILTDTSSMFTPSDGEKLGFSVAPLTVTIAGKTYREMEEISTPEFIDIINQGNQPTSSQPAPSDLIEIYETATAENPVLHITITDGLSGAYQSACGVRETMDNKEYITVFNSGSLCGPQWVMVKKAVAMAKEGATVDEIVEQLTYLKDNDKSFLIPQDFDYLRRGGRLTPTAAKVGSLLRLVPLMTQTADDRQLEKAGLCRSFAKAVEKCIEGFHKLGVGEKHMFVISNARNPKDAAIAKEMLTKEFPGCRIDVVDLTPAFTTQGGPLCVAIQSMIDIDKQ
ncbi:MAG: DegV family protein [Oscillospiraceae bacterium]|nr:DegV family protein [Oscillospiraceae bacterium]